MCVYVYSYIGWNDVFNGIQATIMGIAWEV